MAGSINLARVSASERATARIITDAAEVGADALDRSRTRAPAGFAREPSPKVLRPCLRRALPRLLDALRTLKAKKRRGEHRLGSSGPPFFVRCSLMNETREERDCVNR